jgi:hypothetical protein
VHAPAALDHRPVGIVAVHGDVLTAAARGDTGIEAIGRNIPQERLEGNDIVQRAGFRHVAAIKQSMDAHRLYPIRLGPRDHRLQMVDVAMYVAVREEADEVDHPTTGPGAGDHLLPRLALPDAAVGDGIGHQRRALRVDLAGADRIVADLGIAHVVVRRHADSGTVGAQADIRVVGKQAVEGRLARGGDGAADIGFRQAVAIEDDDHDGTGHTGKRGKLVSVTPTACRAMLKNVFWQI